MKKVVLSAAIAAASFGAAAVEVGGSVEYVMSNDNGVYDIVTDDTFVSFSSSEDLGEGVSAYATPSLDVDSEATTAVTNRDAFVGVDLGVVDVSVGRMANVQKVLGSASVDVFEGNGHNLSGAARADNVVKGSVNVGAVSLIGAAVADGAAGEDKADSYEVAVMTDLGAVRGGALYAKDRATDVETKAIVASAAVSGVALGGSFERVGTVDTLNAVASVDVGANTLKVGYADIDAGADTMTFEAVHNFSGRTSAYVNVQDVDTSANEVYQVGLKHSF